MQGKPLPVKSDADAGGLGLRWGGFSQIHFSLPKAGRVQRVALVTDCGYAFAASDGPAIWPLFGEARWREKN